jgi:dihydrofolate synthase/folylpolyglutamate synthase
VLLLETGLGGRLDATNVVAKPAATVITPISLDHQAYLGDTLAAIAAEKAGILKAGVPCVAARQEPEAAAVIRGRAAELGVPLSEQGRHWQVAARDGRMIYADAAGMLSLPLPRLHGAHQVGNAGAAIAALRAFSPVRCGAAAIAEGLRSAVWPARLQRLDTGRLAALLPRGWELWLDGGHNPGAAAALAQHLAGWRDRPAGLVLGLLSSKDAAGFIQPLKPYASAAVTVAIPGEAAAVAAGDLAAVAASVGLRATPAASVADALVSLREQIRRPARVLICGSLYLAGHVLAENSTG